MAPAHLIPIFDPATTGPDGARMPFPGNIIPANRFSAVAKNVLPLIPDPGLSELLQQLPEPHRESRRRIEHGPSKVIIFSVLRSALARAFWRTNTFTQLFAAGAVDADRLLGIQSRERSGAKRKLRLHRSGRRCCIISPLVIQPAIPSASGILARAMRFTNFRACPLDAPGFPVFNVNNTYGNLALGNSNQQPNDPSQNRNISFIDNLTWIKGRHQLKFGGDIRFFQYDNFAGTVNGGLSGSVRIQSSIDSGPQFSEFGQSGKCVGEPPARSGILRTATDSGSAPAYARRILRLVRGRRLKLTRKFTVTLGLRHEIPTVIREADSRQSSLNLSLQIPALEDGLGRLEFLKPGDATSGNITRAFRPE